MAAVNFSGSSKRDIENAKAFWRTIDPPPKLLSTLTVSGVDHRLPRAPDPPGNAFQHTPCLLQPRQEYDSALEQHQETAQRLKEEEETAYINRIQSFKEEEQRLLQKRKQEREKKEEISNRTLTARRDPFEDLFEASDDDQDEDEASRTMNELDKFESNLRQKEAIKPL